MFQQIKKKKEKCCHHKNTDLEILFNKINVDILYFDALLSFGVPALCC